MAVATAGKAGFRRWRLRTRGTGNVSEKVLPKLRPERDHYPRSREQEWVYCRDFAPYLGAHYSPVADHLAHLLGNSIRRGDRDESKAASELPHLQDSSGRTVGAEVRLLLCKNRERTRSFDLSAHKR